MTYAHDAHCNVIHEPGLQECPPHCDDEQHISGGPCPSCGSRLYHPGHPLSSVDAVVAEVERLFDLPAGHRLAFDWTPLRRGH